MYNEKQIRQLLTRFMEGQTTVEEEQDSPVVCRPSRGGSRLGRLSADVCLL